ncbi:MAG: 16S rRNA (guanine(966)-N(2))-methyltransferase RsmD [Aestuariibacter sp.]
MKRNNSGQIRIIAGKWRGRKLPVADSPGLRPTTDRTKETLFNWLMPYLHQEMRCLDLFTGSGGLALEALSRGVAHVTMVEKEPAIVKTLKHIQRTLGCQDPELAIVKQEALRFLAASAPQQPYDLVFLDPPFGIGLLQPCIESLLANNWLAEDALIYIEHESSLDLSIPTSFTEIKSKNTKQVSYRLLSLD